MSTTPHLGDLLSAYLDGELAPGEEEGVRDHLDTCADCRRELQLIGDGRSLLRSHSVAPICAPGGRSRSATR